MTCERAMFVEDPVGRRAVGREQIRIAVAVAVATIEERMRNRRVVLLGSRRLISARQRLRRHADLVPNSPVDCDDARLRFALFALRKRVQERVRSDVIDLTALRDGSRRRRE